MYIKLTKQGKVKTMQLSEADRLIQIFKLLGLKVKIEGCGCCGSPEVRVEYHDEEIIDDTCVNIDMFKNLDEITVESKYHPSFSAIMDDVPPGTYKGKLLSVENNGKVVAFEITEGPYKGKIVGD